MFDLWLAAATAVLRRDGGRRGKKKKMKRKLELKNRIFFCLSFVSVKKGGLFVVVVVVV